MPISRHAVQQGPIVYANFNIHLNDLPSYIRCWDKVDDIWISMKLNPAVYLNSESLVSVPI